MLKELELTQDPRLLPANELMQLTKPMYHTWLVKRANAGLANETDLSCYHVLLYKEVDSKSEQKLYEPFIQTYPKRDVDAQSIDILKTVRDSGYTVTILFNPNELVRIEDVKDEKKSGYQKPERKVKREAVMENGQWVEEK